MRTPQCPVPGQKAAYRMSLPKICPGTLESFPLNRVRLFILTKLEQDRGQILLAASEFA
jgi:hypothetical protein